MKVGLAWLAVRYTENEEGIGAEVQREIVNMVEEADSTPVLC